MLTWITWLIIAFALAAVIYLGRNLAARFASGRIQQIMDRRRASSRLVSRGELIDGNRHLSVALALGTSALYYENADLQASLDLESIGEVDYDDEIVTGQSVGDGKVLTIRCYSQAFAFLIPIGVLAQWQAAFPVRRLAAAADARLDSNRESNRADDDGWPVRAVPDGASL